MASILLAMTANPEDDRRLWQQSGRKEENQEVIEVSSWERTNTHIVGRKDAGLENIHGRVLRVTAKYLVKLGWAVVRGIQGSDTTLNLGNHKS